VFESKVSKLSLGLGRASWLILTTMKSLSTLFAVTALGVAAGAFAQTPTAAPTTAKATFAGGCFWCMEAPFDKIDGVISTTSGYIGGTKKNPTYQEVSAGSTGHTEAVQIVYDPKKVTYEKLLSVFWRNIDPTVKDQQFCDVGTQYRSGVFYHDDAQKAAVEKSKTDLTKTNFYRKGCGRDARLKELWGAEAGGAH
jgi:peptide-methionine (S)-S-oxide reductase